MFTEKPTALSDTCLYAHIMPVTVSSSTSENYPTCPVETSLINSRTWSEHSFNELRSACSSLRFVTLLVVERRATPELRS
jgi:hypothetical protein